MLAVEGLSPLKSFGAGGWPARSAIAVLLTGANTEITQLPATKPQYFLDIRIISVKLTASIKYLALP